MTDRKKKIIENIAIFIFFAVYITFLNLANTNLNYDIIWCFHMSQKVANGYQMYSEISTVVTPIYFWIGGLFIKLFGNHLISMCIYAGVVQGVIALTLFRITKEMTTTKNKWVFPSFMVFMLFFSTHLCLSNYNSTAIMWCLIAVYLEVIREKTHQQRYNYGIGLFLCLTFFTKQNIGAFSVIATGIISIVNGLYYRKENPFREVYQKAVGFLIPCFLFLGYFFLTGTFYDFINYCVGGLLEFGEKNLRLELMPNFYLPMILCFTGLLIALDRKTLDPLLFIIVIYLMGMSTLIYPLTNTYHLLLGTLLLFPLTMRILEYMADGGTVYRIAIALFLFLCRIYTIDVNFKYSGGNESFMENPNNLLDMCYAITILWIYISLALGMISNKENRFKNLLVGGFLLYLICCIGNYVMIKDGYPVTKNLEIYAHHGFSENQMEYIQNVIDYILQKEKEGFKVYVVSSDASYYMAPLGRNQYQYDLMLYGSLGYEGEKRIIEKTRELPSNTLLLKDKNLMFQEPVGFDDFIKEEYQAVEEIENLVVYTAKESEWIK